MASEIKLNPSSISIAVMSALIITAVTAGITDKITRDIWLKKFKKDVSNQIELINSSNIATIVETTEDKKKTNTEQNTASTINSPYQKVNQDDTPPQNTNTSPVIVNQNDKSYIINSQSMPALDNKSPMRQISNIYYIVDKLARDPMSDRMQEEEEKLRQLYCDKANSAYFYSIGKSIVQIKSKEKWWFQDWDNLEIDDILRHPNSWLLDNNSDKVNNIRYVHLPIGQSGITLDLDDPKAINTLNNILNNLRRSAIQHTLNEDISGINVKK